MSSRKYCFIFTRHIAIFARDSARYGCQVSRIRNVGDLAEARVLILPFTPYIFALCSFVLHSLLSRFQIFRSPSFSSISDLASGTKVEIDGLRKSEYRQPISSRFTSWVFPQVVHARFFSFSSCLLPSLLHDRYKLLSHPYSFLFQIHFRSNAWFCFKKRFMHFMWLTLEITAWTIVLNLNWI